MNINLEIGNLLKKTRQDRTLDISKISEVLRIRKQYLQSIEDGKFEEIPGKTYIKGYIKMYADFLGVNKDVELIQNQIKPVRKKLDDVKDKITNDNMILGIFFTILIVLAISLIIFRNAPKSDKIIDYLIESDLDINTQ